ncbi:hypothetical protein [[Phormidium] sp. ETS-05]|uniref:hypothetical protein n=1 Tax=[Phormidium] sp. ETS-05 TaxID=222819 RepID=UPI0018EED08B|nr:hypothetical protein [[Phormidium] sp. ETS-05]
MTLQIGDEDATPNVSLDGKLPPSAEIYLTYGTWKSYYWQKLLLSPPARVNKPLKQVTNYSDTALIESSNLLEQQLNGLLNDGVFRPLKEKFLEKINPDNVVRVIIQTDDPILRRLPWHLWDLFASYRLAEVALYAPAFEGVKQSVQPKAKVRILAILGDRSHPQTGIPIDIEADRGFLESLPDAETVFLVEPNRQEFNDKLWDKNGWDILFLPDIVAVNPMLLPGKCISILMKA